MCKIAIISKTKKFKCKNCKIKFYSDEYKKHYSDPFESIFGTSCKKGWIDICPMCWEKTTSRMVTYDISEDKYNELLTNKQT